MKTFEPSQILCRTHAEPLRSRWPHGYQELVTTLGAYVLADRKFLDEIAGDYRRVHAALNIKPMCCRVPPALLIKTYTDIAIGTVAKCSRCGKTGLGGPYIEINHWGRPKRYAHLCFSCVLKLPSKPLPK